MHKRIEAGTSTALRFAIACTLAALFCLAVPMYVIRPFRPQGTQSLAFALAVRGAGPWISAVCVLIILCATLCAWSRSGGLLPRIAMVSLSVIALVAACLTHVNVFEIMFHPYPAPAFGDANTAQVDADDKILAVRIGAIAHAYPIRILGYHHIVNDTVANVPIAVTYCTLCHSGLVWSRVFDGELLHFRLAGINNGNALIRDEETGSIWQQSTGELIFGALK